MYGVAIGMMRKNDDDDDKLPNNFQNIGTWPFQQMIVCGLARTEINHTCIGPVCPKMHVIGHF